MITIFIDDLNSHGVPVTARGQNPRKNGGNRRYLEQSALQAFYNGPKGEVTLSNTPPEFDRDEALVCMALAFCLAGASTSVIYRLLC